MTQPLIREKLNGHAGGAGAPAARRGGCERALAWMLGAHVLALPLSVAVAEPLAYAALPVWACVLWRRRRLNDLTRCPFFAPVALFILAAVMASALGPRPAYSLAKSDRYLLAATVFMFATVFGREGRAVREAGLWLVGLFVVGATALALYDLVRIPLAVARGGVLFHAGNMRDPQMYMVALCFLIAFLAYGRGRGRFGLAWGALALTAAGLVLHFKRGSWIALAGAVCLMSLVSRRWKTLLLLAAVAAAVAALPATRERLELLRTEFAPGRGGRLVLWTQVAPGIVKDHPMGMGVDAPRHRDFLPYAEVVEPGLDHLHNNPLQVLLETGWAGLACWLAWMGSVLWIGLRGAIRQDRAGADRAWLMTGAAGAFAALMINGLVEYNFGDTEIFMVMNFVAGVTWLAARNERQSGETSRASASQVSSSSRVSKRPSS
jgi:O-antigen ligase